MPRRGVSVGPRQGCRSRAGTRRARGRSRATERCPRPDADEARIRPRGGRMNSRRQRREAYTLREAMFAMRPPVVLVAEDDADVRRLVATALRLEGCSVIEARDGNDLVEQIGSALLFG